MSNDTVLLYVARCIKYDISNAILGAMLIAVPNTAFAPQGGSLWRSLPPDPGALRKGRHRRHLRGRRRVRAQGRVDTVQAACCEQDGVNTCASGAPQRCDAECAAEFLPYWHQCLSERSVVGGEMHQFTVLYTACTDELPEEESLVLYQVRKSPSWPRSWSKCRLLSLYSRTNARADLRLSKLTPLLAPSSSPARTTRPSAASTPRWSSPAPRPSRRI